MVRQSKEQWYKRGKNLLLAVGLMLGMLIPLVLPAQAADNSTNENADAVTLTFDYNGGRGYDGTVSYEVTAWKEDALGRYIENANWQSFYGPYQFTGKWDVYDTETGERLKTNQKAVSTYKIKKNYTLKAIWDTKTPAYYYINYELGKGKFPDGVEATCVYSCEYDDIILEKPMRKSYLFQGFYTDDQYTSKVVTVIPKGSFGVWNLYAKWEKAKPAQASLKKAVHSKTGEVTITFKKMTDVSGYQLQMSQSKKFNKNTNVIDVKKSATSITITNLPKGKTYYFRIRAYQKDSTGQPVYGAYSKTLSRKVKKGVKEYAAKANSAKISGCSIKSGAKLNVKFSVPKRLKSTDDSYYLVQVDPVTGKYAKKVAQAGKTRTVTFSLPVRDAKGTDLSQGKYALAVKSGSKYKIISQARFISNPEKAATYTGAFPKSRSKKGLQGALDADLSLSHSFFNMDVNHVIKDGTEAFQYNGKTYHFNDPWSYYVRDCNAKGITVTGQLILSYDEATKYMIIDSGRTPGHSYYAMNGEEKKARETFEAAMSFLAEKYSKSDCHLDNWVLGNEVNIHPMWYYAGNISRDRFIRNYAATFRILYYAVKSHSANARVYICTDHTWTDHNGHWGAKHFMEAFHKEIKSQDKNIQWNLAYHAYPADLTKAATWSDKGAPDNANASFVTPKNLNVLTSYVKKHYGSKTRIILSEQGFTSSSGTTVQAAALAYTYYKAEFDPMIDAVIFRTDMDNTIEAAQGLYFGLKDLSGNPKPAYTVFQYMDSAQAEQYTNQYLSTIGISKWKEIAPKYNISRFQNQ